MLDSTSGLRPCFPDYCPHGAVARQQGESHSEPSPSEEASLRQRGGISRGMPFCTKSSMHPPRPSIHRSRSSGMPLLCELDGYSWWQCRALTNCTSVQVLYHQYHSRDCRSGLWFSSSVQNGMPNLLLSARIIPRIFSRLIVYTDLPTNRLGRPTHPHPPRRRRRHSLARKTSDRLPPTPHHIQRLSLRRPALEVHTTTARSAGPARRDSASLLHRDEQEFFGYHWSRNI